MYAYTVQQKDIDILRQSTRPTFTRIELLNRDKQVIENLEGQVFNDNFSCDGESKVRRTYTCDLEVINSSFAIGNDKKVWLDKLLRVYYGIKNIISGEIQWYRLGTFKYVDMNYSHTTTAFTLSLSCSDMMSILDGTLGGEIYDFTLKALAGESIRQTIIGILTDAGITDYYIEDEGKEIPYDIEWSAGTSYEQALTELCELYDSWEYFFDEDGRFIWRKIAVVNNEDIILNGEIIAPLVISEAPSDSFKNVFNATKVWGQSIELELSDRNTDSVSYSSGAYQVNFPEYTSFDSIDNNTKMGLMIPTGYPNGKYININGFGNVPIVKEDGTLIGDNYFLAGQKYVFRYRRTLNTELNHKNFIVLGQYQAQGYFEETDPNIPYSIPNVGYKIQKTVVYDQLYSDELCFNQAEYLTYQTTVKQDTLTLNTIIIPFLEPNQKIKYAPRSYQTDVESEWVIKKISWSSLSGTMSMDLYKFNEDFQNIWNERHSS